MSLCLHTYSGTAVSLITGSYSSETMFQRPSTWGIVMSVPLIGVNTLIEGENHATKGANLRHYTGEVKKRYPTEITMG